LSKVRGSQEIVNPDCGFHIASLCKSVIGNNFKAVETIVEIK